MVIGPPNVSLGRATGKTNVLKTGTITTSAITADQVILTYTVTTNKTFYVQYLAVDALFDTLSAVGTQLGTWSVETPSGTKVITLPETNPTTSGNEPAIFTFSEGIPIASAVVLRVVCTPAVTTSIRWYASFGGFEI